VSLGRLCLYQKKSESPNQSQQKCQKDVALTTRQELNWKEAYQMAFQCTKRTKLITFNFKFLHRRISTKSFLKKKNGLADSRNALSVKERETEIGTFLLGLCKTQMFWTSLKVWQQSCQGNPLESHTAA